MYALGSELLYSTWLVSFFFSKLLCVVVAMTILYFIHFIDGHLGNYHLGVIMDDVSTNLLLPVFGEYRLVIYLRQELLSRQDLEIGKLGGERF